MGLNCIPTYLVCGPTCSHTLCIVTDLIQPYWKQPHLFMTWAAGCCTPCDALVFYWNYDFNMSLRRNILHAHFQPDLFTSSLAWRLSSTCRTANFSIHWSVAFPLSVIDSRFLHHVYSLFQCVLIKQVAGSWHGMASRCHHYVISERSHKVTSLSLAVNSL